MIKLYSLDCPMCNVVKKMLDDKHIEYEYINDKEQVQKTGEEQGIDIVPFALIDGKYYKTNELREYIKNKEE